MQPRTSAVIAASLLILWLNAASPGLAQPTDASPDCREWRACQALALEAEAAGAYERFHDLAWLTMQRRGAQDPEVMYLLARSQALSGRPHDSLVMLRRIVGRGVAPTEALTSEAFRRTRTLAGWPAVEQLILEASGGETLQLPTAPPPQPSAATSDSAASHTVSGARPPAVPAAPPGALDSPASAATPHVASAPSSSPAAAPPAFTPVEAARLQKPGLVPGGLAYDAASGRILVGNRLDRTIITISDRLRTANDLVRSQSAGFHDVLALAIDARRGDLWVASGSRDGEEGQTETPGAALHKLQLVSGRPIATFPIDLQDRPGRIAALAVSREGSVFVLDRAEPRLWRFDPARRELGLVARLDLLEPASMALDAAARHAYIAHADGLGRLAFSTGRLTRVAGSDGAGLAALESLGWHRGALVAIERMADAPRRLLRLGLNGAGTSVVKVDVLDPDVPTCAGPSTVTLSGDDVYYLAGEEDGEDGCTIVVRHVKLVSG